MRRKYSDCQRKDGNCTLCPLVNYGHDCRNNPISKLEWYRQTACMTQPQLSAASGVNVRQIQRIEDGSSSAANLAAKNLLALADALAVDPHDLI